MDISVFNQRVFRLSLCQPATNRVVQKGDERCKMIEPTYGSGIQWDRRTGVTAGGPLSRGLG